MFPGALRQTILTAAACMGLAAVSSEAMARDCSGYDSYYRDYNDGPYAHYLCYSGGYQCGHSRSYYHRYENRYDGYYLRRFYDGYRDRDCDHDCY